MQKSKAKRTALFGMLVALAFVLSYAERLIFLPFAVSVPGIKPGLANIVILAALYLLGGRQAAAVAVIRVLLAGFTFNNISMMIYSFGGVFVSFILMLLLKWTGRFEIAGVSVAGGVGHNIGQILVAYLILGRAVVYYLPALMIGGIFSGLFVGILGAIIVKRMKRISNFE